MGHKSKKQYVFLCFLFVLIAYLPITSFSFAIKNDFFTAYFPLKKFLTTAIRTGVLPVWNPYLNYGFPVYGDMSEAWWNPGTWIVAALPGYNAFTFTIEIGVYLVASCLGMFKLAGRWVKKDEWRMVAAVSYAASGFMVGHLQHFNWITGAALLPLCIHFLFNYLEQGTLKTLAASAFTTGWFLTAAHPGLIIGMILFITPVALLMMGSDKRTLTRFSWFATLTMISSAGMIYGYTSVLPYTNRNAGLALAVSEEGSTTLLSWISFLTPLATVKGRMFTNDIALRNLYFGLLGIAACLSILYRRSSAAARIFLVMGVIFLLLSSEIILPVYGHIPLVKYVRLNGEFRLFSICAFVIGSVIQLEKFWDADRQILIRLLRIIQVVLLASILWSGANALPALPAKLRLLPHLKPFLDNLHFYDTLFLQSAIQLVIANVMISMIRAGRTRGLMVLVMADLTLSCLLQLPFTGVGQRSVGSMHRLMAKVPETIASPSLQPETLLAEADQELASVIGDRALWGPEIAQKALVAYPLILQTTASYFDSAVRDTLTQKPAFFLLSGNQSKELLPVDYSASHMRFNIWVSHADTLVIKQNDFPGWEATLNGKPVLPVRIAGTFIGIPLSSNKNELEIRYHHQAVTLLLIFQFISFLALGLIAFLPSRRLSA